jgi:endonuclease G
MKLAIDIYLSTIENMVKRNKFAEVFSSLNDLDRKTNARIGQNLTLIEADYNSMEENVINGLVTPMSQSYLDRQANIRYRLLKLMEMVPQNLELYANYKGLDTFQFYVDDEKASLEKVIGKDNNFLTPGDLENALNASRAVCRVVRGDEESGSGFVTKDGYLFTNHHVLESAEEAEKATLEFNYEVGPSGNIRPISRYKLDPKDFITSPIEEFDFTRVKIIDDSNKPLKEWGYLEIDAETIPSSGAQLSIIQHPKGDDKRIVLGTNEVVGQIDQYLYYSTNTKKGSSGSPVLSKNWKVVALHHGVAMQPINGQEANEGILFKKIMEFVNKQ